MNGKWHELDRFLVRRLQRSQLVKTAGVVLEGSLPYHRPKKITVRLLNLKWKKITSQKRGNIEKLRDKETIKKIPEATGKTFKAMTDKSWNNVTKCLSEAALEVCGKAPKNMDMPWMVRKEGANQEMRGNISIAARNAKEILERVHGPENEEHKQAKELVRVARRRYQREKRRREKQYWNSIIEEAKMA